MTLPPCKVKIAVSAAALRANLRRLREVADGGAAERAALLAVIKADAYGHGAALCAPVLARAGAEWLGVTDAREGAEVRSAMAEAGLAAEQQPEILVMCGGLLADAETVAAERLTPVVWTAEQLRDLAEGRGSGGGAVPVHVEIDTGMGRQGVRAGAELRELLEVLRAMQGVRLDGVLTHFASAEVAGSVLTGQQQERFAEAVEQVRASGLRPGWLHAGNSSTLDEARLLPWLRGQAQLLGARLVARAGLALYGYALPLEGAEARLGGRLEPVATWQTRLLAVREVSPGQTVGYNATFIATEPMRMGLVAIGYADGLRRELSATNERAGGWVIVRGRRARIVGRISMNLTTIDLGEVPEAVAGDEVVVLGEGVSAEVHAALAGTIAYEILCGMRGDRVLVS